MGRRGKSESLKGQREDRDVTSDCDGEAPTMGSPEQMPGPAAALRSLSSINRPLRRPRGDGVTRGISCTALRRTVFYKRENVTLFLIYSFSLLLFNF